MISSCHTIAGKDYGRWRLLAVSALLVFLPTLATADSIDDSIVALMAWERIPGLSLAVIRNGSLVKAKGYGMANLETSTPATPETVYKIASVSKQFIAAAVLVLVQDGKLQLNDPIRRYLDGTPASWEGITVAQLLSHTSGIARDLPDFDPFKVQPDSEFLRASFALPLRFKPGEHWAYSNINYYCLAEIIRKVTGRPWDQYVADRIFAPAGMTRTRTTTVENIVPNRANGYSSGDSGFTNAEVWLALRPSGAFLSTVLDFAKWDAALYSDSILKESSKAAMWSPVTLNDGSTHPYGFGWFIDQKPGHRRLHHGGGVPGFVCEFDRFIDDRITVVIMANIGGRVLEDTAIAVAGDFVPALKALPISAIDDPDPTLAAQIKDIVENLAQHRIGNGPFTASLETELKGEVEKDAFKILASFGPILDVRLIERKADGSGWATSYKVDYRNIELFVDCSRDLTGRIGKFGLHD